MYVYSTAAMIIWYNYTVCQRTCPCISVYGPSFIFLQLVWICWNVRIILCNLLYLTFVFGLVSISNMYSGTSLVIAATLFCTLPTFIVLTPGLCFQLSQALSCQVAGCWEPLTLWQNVRSQKTWIPNHIAMRTSNLVYMVASCSDCIHLLMIVLL